VVDHRTSPLIVGHLSSHQQVNLSPVILVVRETLVHLGLRKHWQARRGNAFDTLAVLQETDRIVHGDPSALQSSVAASHVWRPDDVAIEGAHSKWALDYILRQWR
jgi:hypothetical protein